MLVEVKYIKTKLRNKCTLSYALTNPLTPESGAQHISHQSTLGRHLSRSRTD